MVGPEQESPGRSPASYCLSNREYPKQDQNADSNTVTFVTSERVSFGTLLCEVLGLTASTLNPKPRLSD